MPDLRDAGRPMKVGVLGAGAAGLSAAYFLRDSGHEVQVHEAADAVGGLARSFRWHGFDCDLAPHRFYTDDAELLAEIGRLVPLQRLRRRSRIYVAGRWLTDPLRPFELLLKLPPVRAWRLVRSYLRRPRLPEDSFEALALNRFGVGLHELFFKPYSEKLFGVAANEIAASWGRRKLRLGRSTVRWRRSSRLHFRYFYYPRSGGYGAICEALYQAVKPHVRLGSRLTAIRRDARHGYSCTFDRGGASASERFDLVVSSLPIDYFASLMGLATSLRFRPLRLVYLLVARSRVGRDHWFYFADRDKAINRVSEFKNFAGVVTPRDRTVLCCEVTELGAFSLDRVIAELAGAHILGGPEEVLDTKIVDLERAYPIYDRSYEVQIARLSEFFAQHPDVIQVGRAAQFVHQDLDEIFAEAKTAVTAILNRR